ncbi:hypothetical protein DPMN_043199 [Dreissena polymorpha]|uniref:Uncharacterized protein n=1 Tax=Dreissena polymorpha TaxID=45954 RepID=A0A9D4HXP9_DREPO|nr:hypothetical protein DPMN_043199 [Dreissena polymorpha]
MVVSNAERLGMMVVHKEGCLCGLRMRMRSGFMIEHDHEVRVCVYTMRWGLRMEHEDQEMKHGLGWGWVVGMWVEHKGHCMQVIMRLGHEDGCGAYGWSIGLSVRHEEVVCGWNMMEVECMWV